MEHKEKNWRIAEYIFGGIGAALLLTILILKVLKCDVMLWTLPLVAAVILFLIADDRARSLKRKRLKEEAKADADATTEPEPTLPNEAFVFDETERKEP
ncbi:MAG: hypothetical protein IKF65_00290 [Clostridia bacterium]|nr:hypothetical protein [Clostridia bacterium]